MSPPSWSRHYRRLMAVLILWGLLPLPFTGIVLPPFWLAAAAAAALLWVRPDAPQRLPGWLQNLLAVGILAVVTAVGGLRYGPMRPLGHLLLLLIAVRVLSVGDRRSFLRTLPAVLLLWVAAVASSTHVSLVLYLVGSAVLLWWLGMRVHLAGLLEAIGEPASSCRGPRLRHAALAGAAAVILAVPVFVTLPRIRSPWVAAPGSRSVSGFSSAVELQRLGDIRESREVALMLRRVGSGGYDPSWARLRGTAFELVRAGAWAARWGDVSRPGERDGLIWLRPDRDGLDGTAELLVDLLAAERYLFLPEGTVALRCTLPVAVDPAGGVVLQVRPPGRVTYRVWVRRPPVPDRNAPSGGDTFLPPQDAAVSALAREVTRGRTGAAAQARAVEEYLRTSFEYSTSGGPGGAADPVAHFLLDRRAGHCEFFAGAMVVMMRDLGVPARMVGGYSGGTLDPAGEELLVRQSNAHTWVEVWLGGGAGVGPLRPDSCRRRARRRRPARPRPPEVGLGPGPDPLGPQRPHLRQRRAAGAHRSARVGGGGAGGRTARGTGAPCRGRRRRRPGDRGFGLAGTAAGAAEVAPDRVEGPCGRGRGGPRPSAPAVRSRGSPVRHREVDRGSSRGALAAGGGGGGRAGSSRRGGTLRPG